MSTIYDFSAEGINGQQIDFKDYEGKVLLIVNTASKCGLTPQLESIEALHRTYKARGLVVIGFPCNQFGGQDPGSNHEIKEFCQVNYGVSFQMMKKINVNGQDAHPVYKYLKSRAKGLFCNAIKWNFTKFLISRDGQSVKRYAPITSPTKMVGDIEQMLSAPVD